MDCHNCDLQQSDSSKAICASLLMPAMFNRMFTLMAAHINHTPVINEVLPFGAEGIAEEVKPLKKLKDESIKE